jgi:hypothetical protein
MKAPKLPKQPKAPKQSASADAWAKYAVKKAEWAKKCAAKMAPYNADVATKAAAKAKAEKISFDKTTGKISGVSGKK